MNKITCVLLAIILLSSFAMKLRSEIQSTATGELTAEQSKCLETCAAQFASQSRIQTEFLGGALRWLGSKINPVVDKVVKTIAYPFEKAAKWLFFRIQLTEEGKGDISLEEAETYATFYCSGKCGL